MKTRLNLTLAPDTVEQLRHYADLTHRSISQVVTDWAWTIQANMAAVEGKIATAQRLDSYIVDDLGEHIYIVDDLGEHT